MPGDFSALQTPVSWFIVELLSIALFLWCTADAIRMNDGNRRIARIGEMLGFAGYAAVYENIGVAVGAYRYSLDRIMMVGRVPLSILLIEAVIFYTTMRTAEKLKAPVWAVPIIVGFLGMVQDMTIDPSACFDLHRIQGVSEGRWNWPVRYKNSFFGIPFFNFCGWFTMMAYFASTILIGRRFFERRGQRSGAAAAYVLAAMLVSLVLIVSPLNQFLLTMTPLQPWSDRTNELVMLTAICTASLVVLIRYGRPASKFDWREDKVIWLVPGLLHLYDILAAYVIGIPNAYVPSILFSSAHIGFIAWLFYAPPLPPGLAIEGTSGLPA